MSNTARLCATLRPHGSIAAIEELLLRKAAFNKLLKWFHEGCAPNQGYPVRKAPIRRANARGHAAQLALGKVGFLRSGRLDEWQGLMLTTSSTKNLHQDSCLKCVQQQQRKLL